MSWVFIHSIQQKKRRSTPLLTTSGWWLRTETDLCCAESGVVLPIPIGKAVSCCILSFSDIWQLIQIEYKHKSSLSFTLPRALFVNGALEKRAFKMYRFWSTSNTLQSDSYMGKMPRITTSRWVEKFSNWLRHIITDSLYKSPRNFRPKITSAICAFALFLL